MANMQQPYRRLQFRVAYLETRGTAFEEWFGRLAGYALGTDFEPVSAWGSEGDFKCDGRQLSTGTIFQCYAPGTLREDRLIAKIDRDFRGALEHWGDWMKAWVLVHNIQSGFPPRAIQRLDALRREHPEISIESWSEPQLLRLTERLDATAADVLFGPVPSASHVQDVAFDDLVQVIDRLQQLEPEPNDALLTPPSVAKLQKNALSSAVADLLRAGRRKEGLVETYFRTHPRPDLGERIAEFFRQRYAGLVALDRTPDEIFGTLQNDAGFGGPPKRQGAVLAVLSYFFERCDIFEDPVTADDTSN